MTFRDALEALICCRARPVSVHSMPKVSSVAVGVIWLASRMPSIVKYHNSTYSMALILSVAKVAGKKGRLCGMEEFMSKSVNIGSFRAGRIASASRGGPMTGGVGERAGGVGGAWSRGPLVIGIVP